MLIKGFTTLDHKISSDIRERLEVTNRAEEIREFKKTSITIWKLWKETNFRNCIQLLTDVTTRFKTAKEKIERPSVI
jgi:hypothetical protein